jgi:nitroimidazol reductase NimA-like FMN-containing flavoprotein (pyridoxamine 5'-phosphate oxidase superfamily)
MGERRDFDVDRFLARPLLARLATVGPTVRPVWFLWEDGAFWWLTGSWAALTRHLERDPTVALVVDTCDLATGEVLQVRARGRAELWPYDVERARRKLLPYLGPDEASWDPERFAMDDSQDTRFVRLVPDRLEALDVSYRAAPGAPS